MNSENYNSIPDFYAGKSVFITGGSGYLGKVLIEKLLYSCQMIDKIYMLLRDKANITAEQRLRNIINLPVFSRTGPEYQEKIVIIRGDLLSSNLGMSPEDLQTVQDKVSVVIHSAATTKFNEHIKVALAVNLEGTRNVINLCHCLKHIQAFVYVSTAYSNSNRSVIEEVVYPPPALIDEVEKFVEKDYGDKDMAKLLNGLPNTYTFTKALAEALVSDTHGHIPTVIVRPSIVTPAIQEPLPGWVDNWFGPTGVMTAVAMGTCRVLYAQYDNIVDAIPVDYVCNLILVAAARANRSNKLKVYNSCTGSANPLLMRNALRLYAKCSVEDGFNVLPYPQIVLCTKNKWLLKLLMSLTRFFAKFADIVLQVFGKTPRFTEILYKTAKVQEMLSFFTRNAWLIRSPETVALCKSLSSEDYRRFPFNPQDIIWEEYIPIYFHGVKRYLLRK